MGELRFSGLSSGIDTAALVQQLMTIESRRLAAYKVSKMDLEKQTSALNELRTKITALKTAAASLSDINNMQIYAAASSNRDILTATASSDANTGSHSVAVNQLASAETWIQSTSTFNYKTDFVGGGNFIYTYNNQQRVITAVAGQTTLEDLVNLINNDEKNPGVTASLLYQGGKYHLMLNGQDTGQDFQISLDESSREIWKSDTNQPNSTFTNSQQNATLTTKITELDQFSGSLGAADKIIISGKNHAGSDLPALELSITENTTVGHLIDAINEQFDGTATACLENGQIWLTDSSYGTSGLELNLSYSGEAQLNLPTMAVSTEGGAISESLTSLNSSMFIETQNANNAEIRIDGFPSGSTNEKQTLSITGGVPTTGSFRLTLNGQTTAAIAYNASAADIQAALQALAGIEPGDVICEGAGLTDGIEIRFAGNLAGTDITKMTVSDDSSLDAGTVSVVETVKGNDGWLTRNSNNISDAITGINLSLIDVTEADNPVKVTVSRNTSTISKSIQALIDSYNELVNYLKTNTQYDATAKKMGILSRDVSASFLKTQAQIPFTSVAKGFIESIDKFVQADDLGITIDGAGKLEFDSEAFNNAISENYKGILELLGSAKSGKSNSSAVQFYNASDKYTQAGIYNVKVVVNEAGEITSAKIKLSTETEYRDAASWGSNVISFDSNFDDKSDLQLTVSPIQGTYGTDENPIIVQVKQGIFGTLEDTLNELLKTSGQLDISTDAIENKITLMADKIQKEEARLERTEARLTEKYARLEKMLTSMQQQMSSVSALFGNS